MLDLEVTGTWLKPVIDYNSQQCDLRSTKVAVSFLEVRKGF